MSRRGGARTTDRLPTTWCSTASYHSSMVQMRTGAHSSWETRILPIPRSPTACSTAVLDIRTCNWDMTTGTASTPARGETSQTTTSAEVSSRFPPRFPERQSTTIMRGMKPSSATCPPVPGTPGHQPGRHPTRWSFVKVNMTLGGPMLSSITGPGPRLFRLTSLRCTTTATPTTSLMCRTRRSLSPQESTPARFRCR